MFYAKYAALCKRKGVSESKAAENMGLKRSAVSKWKGGAIPQGPTLQKMSEYFGVPVDYLLDKEETPTPRGGRVIIEDPDDFTYAMSQEAPFLSERSKAQLRAMAKILRETDDMEGKT